MLPNLLAIFLTLTMLAQPGTCCCPEPASKDCPCCPMGSESSGMTRLARSCGCRQQSNRCGCDGHECAASRGQCIATRKANAPTSRLQAIAFAFPVGCLVVRAHSPLLTNDSALADFHSNCRAHLLLAHLVI